MKQYYVYIYRDNKGVPFYVGKGTGRRARSHLTRVDETYLSRKIQKLILEDKNINIEIIDAINEDHAFFLEECLIQIFGRLDRKTGTLINQTDGGDGIRGLTFEKKKSQTDKLIGRKHTVETKLKISLAQTGKPKPKHSESTKLKMSLTHKGVKLKPRTLETKEKISHSQRTSLRVLEMRKHHSEVMTGRKASDETKRKMSETRKNKPFSEAHKAGIKAAAIARGLRQREENKLRKNLNEV